MRCAARPAGLVACWTLVVGVAAGAASSASTRSIFDMLPRHEVFPACLKTVIASERHARNAGTAAVKVFAAIGSGNVEPLCEKIVETAPEGPGKPTTAILADCAELGGRIEIASAGGYLGNGNEFCGHIVRDSAKRNQRPLSEYIPNGKTSRRRFCQQFNMFAEEFGTLCTSNKLWKQADSLGDDEPAAERAPSASASSPALRPAAAAEASAAPAAPTPSEAAFATEVEEAALQQKTPSPEFMKSNFGQIFRWGNKGHAEAIDMDA